MRLSRTLPSHPAALAAAARAVVLIVVGTLWAPCGPARADGFVVVAPRPDLPDPIQLAVRYHHVDIDVRDQVASVHIDQVFRNLNDREVEGEYIFPIPEGAAVSDFVLWVAGQPVHAEALDAQRARRIYEEIVRRQKDPALLEYAGRELYRARIYPFPPHGERRVELEYDQLITREGGLYKLVYPLSTEKFSSRPLESATIMIDLEADRPIRNAYCPSHDVEIERVGRRRLRVSWEASGTTPDRDLVFFYSLAEEEFDMRLLPYRPDSGEDGYFMLLASLGADDRVPVQAKDIVFVLDRSGSMAGEKMTQAREALIYCLEQLKSEDRFNVISFGSGVDAFADDLVPAGRGEIKRAVKFVRAVHASGGTNISEALESALAASFSGGRPGFVIFLSDGLATRGERDPLRILEQVADRTRGSGARRGWAPWQDRGGKRGAPRVRIFPFGVGYDVDAPFLDQLADEHGGSPTYVRPTEDLANVVRAFYDQVADPVMTGIEIEFKGARLVDLQPRGLPDLFRGRQLVLFGRYAGDGRVTVTLTGQVGGRTESYDLETHLPRRENESDFIARLWATRRVGALLREIRLYGEEPELVAEVRELGLTFGLGTPYTSFLVDESDRPHPQIDTYAADRGHRHPASDPASAHAPVHAPVHAHAPAHAPAPAQLAATGQASFEFSREIEALRAAKSDPGRVSERARRVGARTFHKSGERWIETGCPDPVRDGIRDVHRVLFGSQEYFALLAEHPELARIFALGERVLFQIAGAWYETRAGQ